MNFFSQNIKWLRKQWGITQGELAEALGVKRSMIGSYEEGRAVPKIPAMQGLSTFFRQSIDDLINRDFSTLGVAEEENDDFKVLTTVVDSSNQERISVVPVKASAGYLNGYADPEYMEELPHFAMPVPELSQERTYRVFQTKGDSMLPIPSGAYIFCEYVLELSDIRDGETYVLLTTDEGVVYKRVENKVGENGTLLLKSDNPEYSPYEVPVETVREVWKAKGFLSFDLPNPEDTQLDNLSAMMLNMKHQLSEINRKL
ncbi:helix-turn-helix domain-containing protein [Prolixibacteraceae bacterium JC049]|nr:helix-turn-helix domain-containing protein [Prolixibacteraceae bacterium JC049]